MLHAIRTLWTLLVLSIVLAAIYFFLNGTSTGARMALHEMLAKEAGPNWGEWIDYSGPTAAEGSYVVQVHALTGRLDVEPPTGWGSTMQAWFSALKTESEQLDIIIRNGSVYYGKVAEGSPVFRYGTSKLGLNADPKGWVIGTAIFALLCAMIAKFLGVRVDKQSKAQQYKRPGSLIRPDATKSSAAVRKK